LNGSMGRVASSADNAAMEAFFALVPKNVLNTRRWQTRDQLRRGGTSLDPGRWGSVWGDTRNLVRSVTPYGGLQALV
jgi:hypothetical protein